MTLTVRAAQITTLEKDLALVHCSSFYSLGRPGVTAEPVPENDPAWREDLAALAAELGFPPDLKPGRHLALDIW